MFSFTHNKKIAKSRYTFSPIRLETIKKLNSTCQSCLDVSGGNSGWNNTYVHFYSERDFAMLSKLYLYSPVDTEISLLEIYPEDTLPKVTKYTGIVTHCIIVYSYKILKAV